MRTNETAGSQTKPAGGFGLGAARCSRVCTPASTTRAGTPRTPPIEYRDSDADAATAIGVVFCCALLCCILAFALATEL